MKSGQEPNILDVTLSEGGLHIQQRLLPEQAASIAEGLQRSHIRYIEVCNGAGIGSFRNAGLGLCDDKELLIAAQRAAPHLIYCVYVSPYPHSLKEIEPLQELFQMARIKVNIDNPLAASEHIKKLKSYNKTVIGQLLRIHIQSPAETAASAVLLEKSGIDILYLTDNFGSMNSEDVKNYIEAVKEKIKIPLGFHGRNYTDQAMNNALTAIESGCDWIDASLLGMGRNAGITCLEVLVSVLQRKGLCKDIDLMELTNTAKWDVLPAYKFLSRIKYTDLLFAKHKIDISPPELIEALANILDMDIEDFVIDLKKHNPQMIQLREENLKDYLAKEKIDWDIAMEYIKTGNIPGSEG